MSYKENQGRGSKWKENNATDQEKKINIREMEMGGRKDLCMIIIKWQLVA